MILLTGATGLAGSFIANEFVRARGFSVPLRSEQMLVENKESRGAGSVADY
jgi:nucleoside-diphosphate-sugar epimerase